MRTEIKTWSDLTDAEREALAYPLGAEAESRFNSFKQAGRDTLINVYYLLTSEKAAGNLWGRVRAIRWAEPNQLGIEVDSAEEFREQLEASGNFESDSSVTLYFKHSLWSLRQVRIDGALITSHGLQIYRPDDPAQPQLLVADIDSVIFTSLSSWPKHALDILRPDPELNDPLNARRSLIERGIFPDDENV
jgi:hypothetical protein